MVEVDRGDDADGRGLDDVCGVQHPAEPDFEQQEIGRGLGEGDEGGGGGHLEEGDRLAGVGGLHALEDFGEVILGDQLARQADALGEADEVGRGEDVDLEARRLGDGPQVGDGRALAVGAGDMDHRRQAALGMAQRGREATHAAEGEVDTLGMQGAQALQRRVVRSQVVAHRRGLRRPFAPVPWSGS